MRKYLEKAVGLAAIIFGGVFLLILMYGLIDNTPFWEPNKPFLLSNQVINKIGSMTFISAVSVLVFLYLRLYPDEFSRSEGRIGLICVLTAALISIVHWTVWSLAGIPVATAFVIFMVGIALLGYSFQKQGGVWKLLGIGCYTLAAQIVFLFAKLPSGIFFSNWQSWVLPTIVTVIAGFVLLLETSKQKTDRSP